MGEGYICTRGFPLQLAVVFYTGLSRHFMLAKIIRVNRMARRLKENTGCAVEGRVKFGWICRKADPLDFSQPWQASSNTKVTTTTL
jgi:hypothetical protein